LIRCKTSSERTVDIHVKSDGSPDTLGVVLGQACEKILWGNGAVANMLQQQDPSLDPRLCLDDELSSMIFGLIFPIWDAYFDVHMTLGGEQHTLSARYSHNQFELQPAACSDFRQYSFVYLVEFREHPALPYHENPRRPWIQLHGDSRAGWPEDFIKLCEGKAEHVEDDSESDVTPGEF
jgi:hypothetical protein